jgi:anti-sigma B factor antagonist
MIWGNTLPGNAATSKGRYSVSLQVGVRETSGISIVDVFGRVTLGEGASLLRDTLRQLAKAGEKKILLNLDGLSYLDSSGIGVLVSSFATLSSLGGKLKLVNLSNRVKDLLLITKLYTVFEVYDDEEAAIGSFIEQTLEAPAHQT